MSKKSRYIGVSFSAGRTNPWRSRASINGSTIFLGYFKTQADAARMYNDFIKASELDRPLNSL